MFLLFSSPSERVRVGFASADIISGRERAVMSFNVLFESEVLRSISVRFLVFF